MIVFFVGTPGSGKSYEAVKKIVDNLRTGRNVCTNIEGMDEPECQEYLKHLLGFSDLRFKQLFRFLTKEELSFFWKTEKRKKSVCTDSGDGVFNDVTIETDELICPHGSLIVIDEAHKHYNARDWNDKEKASVTREMGDWASTHRHFGYDVVFITQSIEKVDKQVRTLTEWTYFFRKVNFLGSAVNKKYMKYSYTGDDHDGKALAKSIETYHPEYFDAYKSYATADAKEVGFMTHVNILKHPIFYVIPVVVCLAFYMLFYKSSIGTGDVLGTKKIAARTEAVRKTAFNNRSTSKLNSSVALTDKPSFNGMTSNKYIIPLSYQKPEYSRYKVDGWINDNGVYIVSFAGSTARLPNPDVLKFNHQTNTIIAKTDVYGTP